jgi:Cu2+-exporting ATPase
VTQSAHVAGGGIRGVVEGRTVVVGSPAFVAARAHGGAPDVDPSLTPVLVAVDGAIVAVAGIGDPVRPDAADAISRLRAEGWSISILSGDAPTVVRTVGTQVGVPAVSCTGSASPETKLQTIEEARTRGPVVMVGDGINDAAAIAAASVGVGVHGGAEACLASADVYLTKPGLRSLVQLTEGAARTMRVIRRNIGFSLLYNLIGAGLAMSGKITPLAAAILMPASSLTVVVTSWRARTFDGAAQ